MSKKKHNKEAKTHEDAKTRSEVKDSDKNKKSELNEFEEKIQQLEAELAAMRDKYHRVCAEYDNLQKRVPRQIQDGISYQKESILKSMLSSMDNFEHTLASAKQNHDADKIIEGIKLVYKNFLDTLKAHGVVQMQSAGEEFDPVKHQAMMQQSDPEKPDNTVLVEYQKGYLIEEKVLRPAMVIVNKIENDSNDDAGETAEDSSDKSTPEKPQDKQE
ncbi:nucleotide exchange factor GrpE [Limihaloglobus sulfuriphilus]|nr:nucleotide exchange factor GrpE [Limihaloglobus sulfuriphilus]